MSGFRNAALVLLLLVPLAQLTGCTGARTLSHEVPGWVKIVLPEHDGRSLFVGGMSLATDPETGIEGATADARSQVHLEATSEFTELFNLSIQKSGVETSAMERRDFKNSITAVYGDRVAELARQDSVFYRPCGDATGAARRAGADYGAPICGIFVLMSVDVAEWDRVLGEVLEVEKRRRMAEGEENLAELAEWLSRQVLEEQPERTRERSR